MAKRERGGRGPREDRTRLVGLHFRNANPEAEPDVVLSSLLGIVHLDTLDRPGWGPRALAGTGRYDPFGVWGPQVAKPVVIAVQGIAFTLSIELALASGIVIAAEDVRFDQLEVARGITPFGGASFRASVQLGWGNAMRFLLTADEFGAEDAMRIGLVQDVVPAGTQLERAADMAGRVAGQAPLGVQATLADARVAGAAGEQAAVEHLRETVPRLLGSADTVEGMRSFLERRAGDFASE